MSYSTYVATRTSLSRRSTDDGPSIGASLAAPPSAVYAAQPAPAAAAGGGGTCLVNAAATAAATTYGLSPASSLTKVAFNRAAVRSSISGASRASQENEASSSSQSNLGPQHQCAGHSTETCSSGVPAATAAAAGKAAAGRCSSPFEQVANSAGHSCGETASQGAVPVSTWGVASAAVFASGSAGPAWFTRRSNDGAAAAAGPSPTQLAPAAHGPARTARAEVSYTSNNTSSSAANMQPAVAAAPAAGAPASVGASGRRGKQAGAAAGEAPGVASSSSSSAGRSSKSPTRRCVDTTRDAYQSLSVGTCVIRVESMTICLH